MTQEEAQALVDKCAPILRLVHNTINEQAELGNPLAVMLKPGGYALTVSGGIAGGTDASAETLPDDIRTNPAYVGRDIAGSLHWNGNIPSLKIGKAG